MTAGQEMSLFVALGLASYLLWRSGRLVAAGAGLGLLAVTRPDGALLGAILLAAELVRSRRLPIGAGVAAAAVAGPWYAYAWLTYGSPLPFPLTAKVAQAATGWWQTVGPAALAWVAETMARTPAYLPLAALGVAAALRARSPVVLLLLWQGLQVAAYVGLGVAYYPWYLAGLHGVLALFVALGVDAAARLIGGATPGRRTIGGALALEVAALVLLPDAQAVRAAGRAVPDAGMRQYEQVAAWLREHTGPASETAALEMGRLGYYGQRPMFDFVGLVKPPVVEHLRRKELIWSVKTYRPGYVIAIPPDRWLLEDPWFRATYLPLRSFRDPAVHGGEPTTVFVRALGDPPADAPARRLEVRFGDAIALVGYSTVQEEDGARRVLLHWRALRPIEREFTVFVHGLDAGGRMVAQSDGPPPAATSSWTPGETVLDARTLPAGVASLRVGLYLRESMQRLPGGDGDSALLPITG